MSRDDSVVNVLLNQCNRYNPDRRSAENGELMQNHKNTLIGGLILTGLVLGGCANTSAYSGSERALLNEISTLKQQQADMQKLVNVLQKQVEDNEYASRQALATAETAQEIAAASDDKLERLFQSTQFK